MTRTDNGLPGVYNALPLTLPDGRGAALALNQQGQLIVDTSGGGNNSKTTITGSGGDVNTHDSQGDDIPSTAIGAVTESLNWHWSVTLGSWARNYGSDYTNIPNAVSVPFTSSRLYALNGANAVPVGADANGNLLTKPGSPSGVGDGRKTVAIAGTREPLVAVSTPVNSVIITALLENTEVVVVGANTVVAAEATRRGTPLSPGDSLSFDIDNLDKVYLDVIVNEQGVSYTYTT